MYACFGLATLFVDGAVYIGHAGTNSFINFPKILIDTGALVLSGIAISEQFFCQYLGWNLDEVSPSSLLSANGATTNLTMQSVGKVKNRINFTNMNLIFSGSAVILKTLSLSLILGVNFLKYNSLSPLVPNTAKLVHTPTQQSQVVIANIIEN